jgi:hypothetical protein
MAECITHREIFIQLKSIFDGCDTLLDALHFGNIYIEKYPHMKSMILSYMNGRSYRDNIDIKTKQSMMNDINMCENRDDALEALSKLIDKTTDDVYRKTLERLAHRKHYRKIERKQINNDIRHNISKKCPHCSRVLNMPENTQYVICGYHNPNHGYDWNGCGRDWCFHCGKMLCKRWETNNLHLQMNRHHDDECCSKHAQENGYNYPDDYCQCNNMNLINTLIK